MEYLDTGQTEDGLYKFKSIQDHSGPYFPSDPANWFVKLGKIISS